MQVGQRAEHLSLDGHRLILGLFDRGRRIISISSTCDHYSVATKKNRASSYAWSNRTILQCFKRLSAAVSRRIDILFTGSNTSTLRTTFSFCSRDYERSVTWYTFPIDTAPIRVMMTYRDVMTAFMPCCYVTSRSLAQNFVEDEVMQNTRQ